MQALNKIKTESHFRVGLTKLVETYVIIDSF